MKHFLSLLLVSAISALCQWTDSENSNPAAGGGQEPTSTYLIKSGDNLWNISFKFLGDPFRWPEIWRRNAYIKNPHLIYPGNTLVISGTPQALPQAQQQQLVSEAPAATGPDPLSNVTASPVASPQTAAKSDTPDSGFQDSLFFLGLRMRSFLGAETIERSAFLWFDKDRTGLIYPGVGMIDKKQTLGAMASYAEEVYRQFDEIPLTTFGNHVFSVGDTVDIIHSDRFIRFKGRTANVCRRTGRACIIQAKGPTARALLFRCWDVISAADRIDSMNHVHSWEIDSIEVANTVIAGTIFYRVEQTERPYLYHTFLCDKGSQEGVRLGDLFAVYSKDASTAARKPQAIACAINVGAASSTLCIEKLYSNSVETEDSLELIRRITFK